jgi:hypothetical protein
VALGIPDAEDIMTPGGEHSMSFATRLLLVGKNIIPNWQISASKSSSRNGSERAFAG